MGALRPTRGIPALAAPHILADLLDAISNDVLVAYAIERDDSELTEFYEEHW